jgi:hypothetical protein
MRETRLSGSEGGGAASLGSPYPYNGLFARSQLAAVARAPQVRPRPEFEYGVAFGRIS